MSDSDLTSGEFPRPRHPVAPWRRRLPGVAIAFNEAEAEPELSPRDMSGAILEASLNTLWMAYQPIVDIPEQRLLGHEALLRTRQKGWTSPLKLLDAAEKVGRLQEVGRIARSMAVAPMANMPPYKAGDAAPPPPSPAPT